MSSSFYVRYLVQKKYHELFNIEFSYSTLPSQDLSNVTHILSNIQLMLKTLASTTNVVVANNVANIECLAYNKSKMKNVKQIQENKARLDNTLMYPT